MCRQKEKQFLVLRPIQTKDHNYKDNDKDMALKIVIAHTAITIKAQRNYIIGITYRTIFFPADERYIVTQSILLSCAREFKAGDECALRINRQYRSLVCMLILLYL